MSFQVSLLRKTVVTQLAFERFILLMNYYIKESRLKTAKVLQYGNSTMDSSLASVLVPASVRRTLWPNGKTRQKSSVKKIVKLSYRKVANNSK